MGKDVKHVFEFLRHCDNKKALLDLVSQESYYQNVSEDTYDVLTKYADTKGIVNMDKYKNENGGVNMCKGLRDLIDDSREEGREEGREEIIVKMLRKGMTVEDICKLYPIEWTR